MGEALAGEVGAVVRHERLAFPSYPYEWPAEMLHASGLLTLDLALAAFDEGLGLKDATPWNVLFRGPTPIFVDWLSVERRDAHDPTWLPYAQFVRTFLLPLIAHREFQTPLDQIFLSRRDGLEPEDVYRASGPLSRLKPALLAHATLPTWLARGSKASDAQTWAPKRIEDAERARYVLRSVFTRLRRAIVAPRTGSHRLGVDRLHGRQEPLLRRRLCGQGAVRPGDARAGASGASARRRLQHRPLQRAGGQGRRQRRGSRRRRGGGRARLAAGRGRPARHPAAGGQPGAPQPRHRLAQRRVSVVSRRAPRAMPTSC